MQIKQEVSRTRLGKTRSVRTAENSSKQYPIILELSGTHVDQNTFIWDSLTSLEKTKLF